MRQGKKAVTEKPKVPLVSNDSIHLNVTGHGPVLTIAPRQGL